MVEAGHLHVSVESALTGPQPNFTAYTPRHFITCDKIFNVIPEAS